MKTAILLTTAASAAASVTLHPAPLAVHQQPDVPFTNSEFDCDAEFSAFESHHGKSYATSGDLAARRGIFCDRLNEIVAHNSNMEASGATYWMSVNEFSDMSFTEFSDRYLGMREEMSNETRALRGRSDVMQYDPSTSVPNSVDHSDKLPAIKTQLCGDCWAFSATASLDFLGGSHSEQQWVDCTQWSCDGGWYMDAWAEANTNGACSLDSYPYQGSDGSCSEAGCDVITKGVSTTYVSKNTVIPAGSMLDEIDAAASEHVVSIALGASEAFMSYGGGVYNGGCDPMNHAINIVGYDADNYKIRNSWGTSWGESGYMTFAKGQCELWNVAYPTL